ncbi:MAG: D-aminoacyl-tRNA deacylase [Oscillospiraceae bacterium]
MRIVLQRVLSAGVTVDGVVAGEIGKGFLVLLGVGAGDSEADCARLADKLAGLRIFSDENDKINLSLRDVGGEILVVSQFTLYADCRKGNRPNFTAAASPKEAARLYEHFIALLRQKMGLAVPCGVFGADMRVQLVNDGPFTLILE